MSRFLRRLYPTFISLLGSLGLGTALFYFVGAYLAFRPGYQDWAEVFTPWAVPMVIVPYALLTAHLYLRTELGAWFIKHGELDEAVAFCRDRLEPGLLRSQKEALIHRINLGRAYIALDGYERAREVLESGCSMKRTGREALRVRYWLLELALRQEHFEQVDDLFEAIREQEKPGEVRGRLFAARAELAALNDALPDFERLLEDAQWMAEDDWRIRLSEGFGLVAFGRTESEWTRARDILNNVSSEANAAIPGRAAELAALRARLNARIGDRQAAKDALKEARESSADARAKRIVSKIDAEMTTRFEPSSA